MMVSLLDSDGGCGWRNVSSKIRSNIPNTRKFCCSRCSLCSQKTISIHSSPPPELGAQGQRLQPGLLDNRVDCFFLPASAVVMADHIPGRDDRGPLHWRFCWLGSEVVDAHPKPTRHMPMCLNKMTAGGGISDFAGLDMQISISA
jgi:hypothetical protein